MKRLFITALIILFALSASSAFGGVIGSKHDLTGIQDTATEERGAVCVFCHVPFGTAESVPAPLWAPEQKAEDRVTRYNFYSWETATAPNAGERPGASTLNCLACHDGTIGKSISFDYIATPESHHRTVTGKFDSAFDHKAGTPSKQSAGYGHPSSVIYTPGKAGLTSIDKAKEKGAILSGVDENRVECVACHSPHITGIPFTLLKPVNDLCSICHEGKASGKHVMASYGFGDDHPVKGKPDPLKAGKDLSCVSCHSPHPRQPLIARELETPANMCLNCHKKISVRTNAP